MSQACPLTGYLPWYYLWINCRSLINKQSVCHSLVHGQTMRKCSGNIHEHIFSACCWRQCLQKTVFMNSTFAVMTFISKSFSWIWHWVLLELTSTFFHILWPLKNFSQWISTNNVQLLCTTHSSFEAGINFVTSCTYYFRYGNLKITHYVWNNNRLQPTLYGSFN
jgi:hypothetical protein